MITVNKTCIENQHIFVGTCKDLGVGGWGLKNPYCVRILNLLKIIGRSLIQVDLWSDTIAIDLSISTQPSLVKNLGRV